MGFYKDQNGVQLEGFLGDFDECEILYVLREPNTEGERPDCFWFKKVLNGDCANGNRYIGVLGRLYNIVKGKSSVEKDVLINNLKKCCYINLNPDFGYSSASKKYKDILKEFRKHEGETKKRWEIIDELIIEYGCKCIITMPEIFSILCPDDKVTNEMIEYDTKCFRVGKYMDATVYEFYHPSYRKLSYDKLNSSKIRRYK